MVVLGVLYRNSSEGSIFGSALSGVMHNGEGESAFSVRLLPK